MKRTVVIATGLACILATAALAQTHKRSVPNLTTEDVLLGRPAPVPADASAGEPLRETETPKGRFNSRIEWRHRIGQALDDASRGGKLVVVDVYTDWCVWCHRMDEDIYSSPQVAALSRDVVFLKLNAEDGGEGQRFARSARVTGFPTTYILDQSGNIIHSAKGYIRSPGAFVSFVHQAKNKR